MFLIELHHSCHRYALCIIGEVPTVVMFKAVQRVKYREATPWGNKREKSLSLVVSVVRCCCLADPSKSAFHHGLSKCVSTLSSTRYLLANIENQRFPCCK